MEFSRQEYWSGLPFPSPEGLPYPEAESGSSAKQAESLPSKPPGKPHCIQSLIENALYSIHTICVCILLLRKIMKETWEFLMIIETLRSAIQIFQKVNIGFTMILTGNGMVMKGIFLLKWILLYH